jgi:hypothetical protein
MLPQSERLVLAFPFLVHYFYDGIYDYVKNYVGGAGDVYPSLIQAVLPRILYAAAPPGNSAWENRKQCLKVSTFDGLDGVDITCCPAFFFLLLTSLSFNY